MMNGDNLESDECIRHTMVHQTQREHHEEGNQEQGNGSQQDEDNQDSTNKMWSVLQVLLIVSAMGLAGSVLAAGFVISLAPITNATSQVLKSELISSNS